MTEDVNRLYDMLFNEFNKYCKEKEVVKSPKNYFVFVGRYFEELKSEVDELSKLYDENKNQKNLKVKN